MPQLDVLGGLMGGLMVLSESTPILFVANFCCTVGFMIQVLLVHVWDSEKANISVSPMQLGFDLAHQRHHNIGQNCLFDFGPRYRIK